MRGNHNLASGDKAAKGRVVLITGGAGTVGMAIARALADTGSTVALLDRDLSALRASAALGPRDRVLRLPCDLLDPDAITKAVDQLTRSLGPVDVLVNNGGVIGPIGAVVEADLDEWDVVMRINFAAPLQLSRIVLPGMLRRRFGRIINVSSRAVLAPPGPHTIYSVSKIALTRLTGHLARELAGTGVTANAICPGGVRSGMWAEIRDALRGSSSEDLAELAAYVEAVAKKGASAEDAAQLVLRIIDDEINGAFLAYDGAEQRVVQNLLAGADGAVSRPSH